MSAVPVVKVKKVDEHGNEIKATRGVLKPELISYFRSILTELERDQDEEDRAILIQNVFAECVGFEYHLCRSASCSPTMDLLLKLASAQPLCKFFTALLTDKEKLLELCMDRCASHCLEAILLRVPNILLQQSTGAFVEDRSGDADEAPAQPMASLFEQMCRSLEGQWLQIMQNPHGSYLFRDVVKILGGHLEMQEATRRHHNDPEPLKPSLAHLPECANELLLGIAQCFSQSEANQIYPLSTNMHISACLPALFDALKRQNLQSEIDLVSQQLLSWNAYRVPPLPLSAHQLDQFDSELAVSKKSTKKSAAADSDDDAQTTKSSQSVTAPPKTAASSAFRAAVVQESSSDESSDSDSELDVPWYQRQQKSRGGKAQRKKQAEKSDAVDDDAAKKSDAKTEVKAETSSKVDEEDERDSDFVDRKSIRHVRQTMSDKTGSRTIEAILQFSSIEVVTRLFVHHFAKQLSALSRHAMSTFCVQSLFQRLSEAVAVQDKHKDKAAYKLARAEGKWKTAIVTACVDELSPQFASLFDCNRGAVVWKLVAAAAACDCANSELYQSIVAAVKSPRSSAAFEGVRLRSELLASFFSLPASEKSEKTEVRSQFSPVGVSLVVALLEFPLTDCAALLESILSLPTDDFCRLCMDRLGSRVFEQCLLLLLPQQKKYLLKRLKGRVIDLALERFGGFCLEKLYHAVDLESKKLIMEELAASIYKLSSTVSGKFILHTLKIEDFKHRRGEWAQKQSTSEKVKRQFADLLDDKPDDKKSKPKKPQQQPQSDDIDDMFDALPSSKRQKA